MLKLVEDDDQAPEGQVWVCEVCGNTGMSRRNMPDASCATWAVLCFERTSDREPWKAVPLSC